MFSWEGLENIGEGRANLGEDVPVFVYRMMQFAMMDTLSRIHGLRNARGYFRQAGLLAGLEFAKHLLNLRQEFSVFLAELQKQLREMKIGILRIEAFDEKSGRIVLTLSEDLGCSNVTASNELICCYDEGFFAGILEAYMGIKYDVREVNCWASSDPVYRFEGMPKPSHNIAAL